MKLLLLSVLIVLPGCDPYPERKTKGAPVTHRVQYLRDERTGLCFAFMRGKSLDQGPALVLVPCDSLPPEIVNTVE